MTTRADDTLKSPNFAFLAVHEPQLVRLGTLAEQYFAPDPMVTGEERNCPNVRPT